MFNISVAGNRVDIFSEGIDFRITGSLVTGTFMVANIEAIGYNWDVTSVSGTLVNVRLIVSGEDTCAIRNNISDAIIYYTPIYALEMGVVSRDASDIAGTATQILTEANFYAWGNRTALRNGDYIYIRNQDYANEYYTCVFREHKISNNTNIDIIAEEIRTDEDWVEYSYASFLVDRKIVTVVTHDYAASSIIVVDFNDSSATSIGTIYSGESVLTLLKSNGDTWIYVFGQDVSDNFIIMAKNYTQSGDWETIDLGFGAESYNHSTPIFVQEDYIVVFHSFGAGGVCAAVVDLSDNSVQQTDTTSTEKYLYNVTQGYDDGAAYVGSSNSIIQVIPSTLAITTVYSSGGAISAYMLSDRVDAYFSKYVAPNYVLYTLPDGTELGSFTLVPQNRSSLMDDDGTIWEIGWEAPPSTVSTLYHRNQDGTLIQSYSLSLSLTYGISYAMLLHAGDSFILHVLEFSGGSNWIHWYHIT